MIACLLKNGRSGALNPDPYAFCVAKENPLMLSFQSGLDETDRSTWHGTTVRDSGHDFYVVSPLTFLNHHCP